VRKRREQTMLIEETIEKRTEIENEGTRRKKERRRRRRRRRK
jgi:hypothetical protein